MVTVEQIKRLLADNRQMLEELNVSRLFVFGSVARAEANTDSDIDVLVDFAGEPTFLGFMHLKENLEQLFGTEVDLATRNALRRALRPTIESEAVQVA